MIYPYEYYLNLLFVRGANNITIIKKTKSFCGAPPTEEDIIDKRAEALALLPQELTSKITAGEFNDDYARILEKYIDSLAILNLQDVSGIFLNKRVPHWDEALYIVSDNEIKLPIQCLAVYGTSSEQILEILNTRYSANITQEGLNTYIKYFWNIPRMSKLEVFHFITNIESSKIRMSLLEAFHKKTDVIKWKYIGENVLTFESILKEIMNEAFIKFKHSVKESGIDDCTTVSQWAALTMKAAEKYDKLFRKTDINLLNQLEFEIQKKSQSDIPIKDSIKDDIL